MLTAVYFGSSFLSLLHLFPSTFFVFYLRSRDVAEVNVSMQFIPKSINIQQQNCQINIRKTICIDATICFKTRLKSKEDIFESSK